MSLRDDLEIGLHDEHLGHEAPVGGGIVAVQDANRCARSTPGCAGRWARRDLLDPAGARALRPGPGDLDVVHRDVRLHHGLLLAGDPLVEEDHAELRGHREPATRRGRRVTPATSACSCSVTSAARSGATLPSRTANSSPPSRATASVPRTRCLQRRGHELEQVVAGLVAEGVVNGLEAVEVHEQERRLLAVAPTARDLATELLLETPPVPQIGERIVVGEALQRGLHALARRDVLDVDDEVDRLTIGVAHQRARDLGPDEPSASGEVDLLHRVALGLPVEQGCDLLAVGIEVLRVRDRLEGEGQELLLGIARDLRSERLTFRKAPSRSTSAMPIGASAKARSKRSSACCLAALGELARREVDEVGDDVARLVARVTHDDAAAEGPDDLAVGSQVALLDRHRLARGVHGGVRAMRRPDVVGMADLDRRMPDELGFGAAEHGAQRVVDAQEAPVQPDHGHAVGRGGERRLEHRAGLAVGGLGRLPLAEILRPRDPVQRPAVAVDGGDRLGLDGKHAAVHAHVLGGHSEVTLAPGLRDEIGHLVLPRRGQDGARRAARRSRRGLRRASRRRRG